MADVEAELPPAPAPVVPAAPAVDDSVVSGEGNEDAEVAELKEMIKRPPQNPPRSKKNKSKAPKKPLPEWDTTPHRPHPPALRGLKTDREPWAKDAKVYGDGMSGHGAVRRRGATVRQPRREEIEREYREGYEKWMKEAGWNSTPFRNAPWQIRGLNPVTREPWFEDMAIYNAKFGPKEDEADEMFIDGTFGASIAITETEQEKAWDSSIMKYVPYSLRGLKPVTNEPWARDEAVYRRKDGMDEIADEYVTKDHFLAPGVSDDQPGSWDGSAAPPKGALRAYPK